MRAVAAVWPGGAQRVAFQIFCTPHKARTRPQAAAILAEGERLRIPTTFGHVQAWSWGQGPIILLHHGWSGNASQMTAFVGPLVAAGCRVVAYDAPAHGESSGRITSGPTMARTMLQVAEHLGGVQGVVAHSMGCFATLLAVAWGLDLRGAVLVAPPADMRPFFDEFGRHLGLSPRDQLGLRQRGEARFDFRYDDLCVEALVGESPPSLLIVHDEGDPVVPVAEAQRIAGVFEGAELVITQGLGHSGARRDTAVVARAAGFFKQHAVAVAEAG